jgi:hypothetical protein
MQYRRDGWLEQVFKSWDRERDRRNQRSEIKHLIPDPRSPVF